MFGYEEELQDKIKELESQIKALKEGLETTRNRLILLGESTIILDKLLKK